MNSKSAASGTAFVRATLSRRVTLTIMLPFVTAFCLFLSLSNLSHQIADAAERERIAQAAISDYILLSHFVVQSGMELAEYSITSGTTRLDSYNRVQEQLPDVIARLEKASYISPRMHRIALEIQETANVMLRLSKETVLITDSGGKDIAELRQREIHNLIEPCIIRLTGLFAAFSSELDDYLAGSPAASRSVRKTTLYVSIGGLLILIAVTVVVIAHLTRGISSRLEGLTENSRRLAGARPLLPPLAGNDEISEIDRAFHTMADLLESSRQKELAAVVGAGDVICSVAGDLTIKTANPAANRVLGLLPEKLIGESALSLAHESERSRLYAQFTKARQEGHVSFKAAYNRDDGATLSILWVVSWSDIDQTFFCVLHDISELESLEQRLVESEQQLGTIFAKMPVGLFVLDRNRRIRLSNARAAAMLGVDASDLQGRLFSDILPTDQESSWKESVWVLRQLNRMSSTPITVELTERQLSEQNDESLIVVLDVTERQNQRDRRAGVVSSLVAEVAAPLERISQTIHVLHDSVKHNSVQFNRLSALSSECERLLRLFNELLSAEALEEFSFSSLPKPTALRETVEWSMELAREAAGRKNIVLKCDCDEVAINLDRDRFMQILSNLLSNAIKFAPEHSTVTVSGRKSAAGFVLSVQDEGPGIPEGKEQEIFEQFRQVSRDDAYKRGGAGLGLFICQTLAHQLNGMLTVSNNEGPGCTFTLFIPDEQVN